MAESTTSNIIKCASCNIVICEVLAFIQNKQNVMDAESLVRICASSFTPKEIDSAKSLLFDSLSTKVRKVVRKNAGKTLRDLNDVIALFRKTDPEELPTFVARDLHRLPPLTFDHIDCTRLLKDIIILKNEISIIKDTYVTEQQFNDIKNEVLNLQQASLINNFDLNVNRKRGVGIVNNSFYNTDSGPYGLLQFVQNKDEGSAPVSDNYRPIAARDLESAPTNRLSRSPPQKSLPSEQTRGADAEKETAVIEHAHTAEARETELQYEPAVGVCPKLPVEAAASSCGNCYKDEKVSDDQWILVGERKRKSRFKGSEGKALIELDGKFKAAEKTIPLFINKVDKQTSGEDIIDYVKEKTGLSVDLRKINSRTQKRYDAYKMFVPHTKISLFLDDGFWPQGIRFRRFIYFDRKMYEESKRNTVDKEIKSNN